MNHPLLMEIYEQLLMKDKQKLIMGYNEEHLNWILKEDIVVRYKLWLRDGNPILIDEKKDNWIKLIDKYEELCQPQQITQYGYTTLMWACDYKLEQVAIKLIDTFGELCLPQHINQFGYTALIYACYSKLEQVAIKLIDTFGELCLPQQKNNAEKTALDYARENDMVIMVKLLERYQKN